MSVLQARFFLDSAVSAPGVGSGLSVGLPVAPSKGVARYRVPRPTKPPLSALRLRPVPTARVAMPLAPEAGALKKGFHAESPRPEYILCTTTEAQATFQ